jgi:metal-responsive CopG/Arc/MetJ family transcriptional regulator
MTTQLAIRLPDELIRQLDELVPEKHSTRSEAVRRAIEVYLYRLACERDAEIYARFPLTEEEMAQANSPEVLSTLPPW